MGPAEAPVITEGLKVSVRNISIILTCNVPKNTDPWGRKHNKYDTPANKHLVSSRQILITLIMYLYSTELEIFFKYNFT